MSSFSKRKRPGSWAAAIKRRSKSRGAKSAVRNQLFGMELKYVDYNYSGTVVTTTAGAEADPTTADCLNAIAQGDGASQRDGRQVILKEIEVRGNVQIQAQSDAADPNGGATVRVLLVQDKQTNAAQLNSEDVLVDGAGLDVNSMTNLDFEGRFRILKEFMTTVYPTVAFSDGASTGAVSGNTKYFHWKMSCNIPVNYPLTTAVVGAISDQSIHVIAIASRATATLDYTSRVRFVG